MTEQRQSIQYIEIDINYCSRTYGVAPCTAAIGVTGGAKCFNTVASCQDSANYAASEVTLRFSESPSYRALDDLTVIPVLRSVDFSPGRINPGEGLGELSTLKVVLRDGPHSDTGVGFDKYYADRAVDATTVGTLFGKFKARQPYLRGRAIRWYQGFADQSLAEMEIRHFIIEGFDGPTPSGDYIINAIDPTKLLSGDRAQAPFDSNGKLTSDITSGATSFTISPAGVGAEYPSSGYIAIGGTEIVSFTRASDIFTIVRAQLGTVASAHSTSDRVQLVLYYSAQDVAVIINDLMTTYANVPSGYIPLTEWQTETAAYLGRTYTGIICFSTSVMKLLSELIRDCGLSFWWDDLAGLFRLKVLRKMTSSSQSFTMENIVKDSFSRKEQISKRVSQIGTYYAKANPLDPDDNPNNFRSLVVTIDTASEANYGSSAIKKIVSRWITQGALSTAERVNDLQISRFSKPPRLFTFSVMRGAQEDPVLGNQYTLNHITEQNFDGTLEDINVQIVRITPKKDRFIIEAEEISFSSIASDDPSIHPITFDFNDKNVNARTVHDSIFGAPEDGDTVNIYIESNVVIGSASVSSAALDIGSWPTLTKTGNRTSGSPTLTGITSTAGIKVGQRVTGTGIPADSKVLSFVANTSITLDKNATSGAGTATTLTIYSVIINVYNKGTIAGKGGRGGTGADGAGDIPGTAGEAGGTALYCRYPINLTDTSGNELGGGGGGGGGPIGKTGNDHKGGGGGGGAGYDPGDGGEGPGKGSEGSAGTSSDGGSGGNGWTSSGFFENAYSNSSKRGGDGGDSGQAGQAGQGTYAVAGGSGGAAGAAIDGISYIITVGSAGNRLGGQVN